MCSSPQQKHRTLAQVFTSHFIRTFSSVRNIRIHIAVGGDWGGQALHDWLAMSATGAAVCVWEGLVLRGCYPWPVALCSHSQLISCEWRKFKKMGQSEVGRDPTGVGLRLSRAVLLFPNVSGPALCCQQSWTVEPQSVQPAQGQGEGERVHWQGRVSRTWVFDVWPSWFVVVTSGVFLCYFFFFI